MWHFVHSLLKGQSCVTPLGVKLGEMGPEVPMHVVKRKRRQACAEMCFKAFQAVETQRLAEPAKDE